MDKCKHCGACEKHDRCDHCGHCRKCGKYVAEPVFVPNVWPTYPQYEPPYKITWTVQPNTTTMIIPNVSAECVSSTAVYYGWPDNLTLT